MGQDQIICYICFYHRTPVLKDFNMDSLVIVLSVLIFGLIFFYMWTLLRQMSKEQFWTTALVTGTVATVAVGFLVHLVVMSSMGGLNDWLTIVVMSLTSTVEMFIGSTKMFDNGFNEFLFPGHGEYTGALSDLCLILMTGAYIAALATSAYIVLTFFFRRLGSRSWVKKNAPGSGQTVHVFFGDNPNSRLLSADVLANNPGDWVLRIDYPGERDRDVDASLWSRLLATFFPKGVSNAEGIIVLKSRSSLSSALPEDFSGSLGLDLTNWLTQSTVVYLLSDDEATTRKELRVLLQAISHGNGGTQGAGITCKKIYCHGRRSELDVESEYAYVPRNDGGSGTIYPEIIFRDSSKLAIRSLLRPADKNLKSALPVDYIPIAVDKEGNKLGYVESGFKSIIIGLGETGLEALKFLYEYASFPDKDGKKSPFLCRIFDKDIPGQRKLFYEELSWAGPLAVDNGGKEIEFINEEVNTDAFWEKFEDGIEQVNYIFVCLGDDKLNLSVANAILNHHLKGRDTGDRFVILLKQRNPDEMALKTIESINAKNKECIRVFGEAKEIWRHNVVSDNPMREEAIRYSITYQKGTSYPKEFAREEAPKFGIDAGGWDNFIWDADDVQKKQIETDWNSYLSGKTDEERQALEDRWSEELRKKWNSRDEIIRTGERKARATNLRQRTQDISNVLHASTKQALMPAWMLERAGEISAAIPGKFFGKFYDVEDERAKSVLCLLAIGEHLRWNASHIILGYKLGKKDDLLKTHDCLKDYRDLEAAVQHYDWLVIKTTLKLYAESEASKNQITQEG